MDEIITTEAKRVGAEVRNYVREHFELREKLDITPLDDLAEFVAQKVAEAARKAHGEFLCSDCFNSVHVGRVRCSVCSEKKES